MAQIEESVARYLQQLDIRGAQDQSEPLQREDREDEGGKCGPCQTNRYRSLIPMPMAIVGYNVQTAVDTKHHLIVTHEVTNGGIDRSQLVSVAKQTKDTLQTENVDVVADRGYFNSAEILACEEAGITVMLPKGTSKSIPLWCDDRELHTGQRGLCSRMLTGR
jgi:hypothetical protein